MKFPKILKKINVKIVLLIIIILLLSYICYKKYTIEKFQPSNTNVKTFTIEHSHECCGSDSTDGGGATINDSTTTPYLNIATNNDYTTTTTSTTNNDYTDKQQFIGQWRMVYHNTGNNSLDDYLTHTKLSHTQVMDKWEKLEQEFGQEIDNITTLINRIHNKYNTEGELDTTDSEKAYNMLKLLLPDHDDDDDTAKQQLSDDMADLMINDIKKNQPQLPQLSQTELDLIKKKAERSIDITNVMNNYTYINFYDTNKFDSNMGYDGNWFIDKGKLNYMGDTFKYEFINNNEIDMLRDESSDENNFVITGQKLERILGDNPLLPYNP